MQRREHQVTGLGGEQPRFNGLEVAHLADQNDVRILAQRAAQRLRERARVDRHLPLVDHRAVIAVKELDGILDRHDMCRALAVDMVDHRRQRRALAGTGRPGHQHQPALLDRDPFQHRRQAELLDGPNLHRDDAKHQADSAALLEDRATRGH